MRTSPRSEGEGDVRAAGRRRKARGDRAARRRASARRRPRRRRPQPTPRRQAPSRSRSTRAPRASEPFQVRRSGNSKLGVLWGLRGGARRYSELKMGLLPGGAGTKEIAARVLSRELKQLASMGMIARRDYQLVPPKVDYALTE